MGNLYVILLVPKLLMLEERLGPKVGYMMSEGLFMNVVRNIQCYYDKKKIFGGHLLEDRNW